MSEYLIDVQSLKKVYGQEDAMVYALNDLSATVTRGEFVAIMGPSGSGKSSLLYLLGLLDLPTAGEVLIRGKATAHMSEEERAFTRLSLLGFVFQFHFLLPEFSILENVTLPMRALGALDHPLAPVGEAAHQFVVRGGVGRGAGPEAHEPDSERQEVHRGAGGTGRVAGPVSGGTPPWSGGAGRRLANFERWRGAGRFALERC